MHDLDRRITVLEFKVDNVTMTFEKFLEQDIQTKKEILDELKKYNTLVSWGKGGAAMFAGIGAILIGAWESSRTSIIHFLTGHY